jgi:Prophage minor tail protein Z (GPZ).
VINIELDPNVLSAINAKLEVVGKEAPYLIQNTLNEVAKKARDMLAEKAQETYALKTNSFKKDMKIKRATKGNLEAVIKTKGGVLELRDFKASPSGYVPGRRKGSLGVKGKVLKSSSMKRLDLGGNKAFIIRFKSGHISVAQRVPGKRMKSNPQKEFVKKLLSPSIPKMIGNEKKVYGIVRPRIEEDIQNSINKHLKRILGG